MVTCKEEKNKKENLLVRTSVCFVPTLYFLNPKFHFPYISLSSITLNYWHTIENRKFAEVDFPYKLLLSLSLFVLRVKKKERE